MRIVPLTLSILTLFAAFSCSAHVVIQDRGERDPMRRAYLGLREGAEALEMLDRDDLARQLERIADDLEEEIEERDHEEVEEEEEREHEEEEREHEEERREHEEKKRSREARKGERSEREQVRHEIEVMRDAMKVLLEGERRDVAELVEHAIHVRELNLAGRRDAEADRVRREAPSLGNQAEAMMLAARLWKKFGHPEGAEVTHELAERLAAAARKKNKNARREGARREIEVAKEQLVWMRKALGVLRESEKKDAAELLHRAIRAREVNLEGRRDEEAQEIRRRGPNRGAVFELMAYAAKLSTEFENKELTAGLREMAEQFRPKNRRAERREESRERRDDGRLRRLEQQIERLQHQIEEMRKGQVRRRRTG